MRNERAPRVSIITPTYNQGRYLGQCITSVINQDFEDWEQIIIDDGSTDETERVVLGFSDPRIHYVRQKNVGILRLGESYNKALSMARGEFIAILEGDDYWSPNALSTLTMAIGRRSVLAFGVAEQSSPEGVPLGQKIPSPRDQARLGPALFNQPLGSALLAMGSSACTTFTWPCATLIRSRALREIGGFQQPPGIPFVDLPTFLQLSLVGSFDFIPKVVAYWRVHPASATRNRDEYQIRSLLFVHVAGLFNTHGSRIGLTEHQIRGALESWPAAMVEIRYQQAKTHSRAGKWPEARQAFLEVVRSGQLRLKLRAGAGLALSTVRIPLRNPWSRG